LESGCQREKKLHSYLDNPLGKGTKAGTVNRELAALSHLLTKAIEWQWIDKRPTMLKRLPESRGRIVYLTVEQAQRLVTVAMQDQNPHIYPFVVIGLETSMRKSEILSIRREHVAIHRRVIYIPKAKAGAREQPITTHLAAFLKGYLDALPEGTPWLFPSLASHTGHTVDIRDAWRRVILAAGLELWLGLTSQIEKCRNFGLIKARLERFFSYLIN
jgi:integrase